MRTAYYGLALGLCAAQTVSANTWRGTGGTGGSGVWNQAGNWSDTSVPNNPATDVLIDGGKAAASTVTLDTSPSINNLTIDSGDALNIGGGFQLYTYGSTTLNGTLALNATASTPYLYFYGNANQSFSGTGTLSLTPGAVSSGLIPRVHNFGSGKVTIGSGLNVASTGDAIINGWFDVNTNLGISTANATLDLSGADGGRRFTNLATIAASNGSIVRMTNFTNAGTISLNNANVVLQGEFTTADLGTITRTGTTVVAVAGTMNNTSATLTLNGTTGSYELQGGTIRNGTVATSGGAAVTIRPGQTGTLDNVTVAAGADVRATTVNGGSNLYVQNGMTLNGTVTLDSTADSGQAYLQFYSPSGAPQTLGGSGTLRLSSSANYRARVDNYFNVSKMTFASGVNIDATTGGEFYGWFDSNTPIGVSTADRFLYASGYDATHRFTNNSTLSASNGSTMVLQNFTNNGTISVTNSTLQLNGEFTTADLGTVTHTGTGSVNINGTLFNAGNTLAITAATGDIELRGSGIVRDGNIATSGGAALAISTSQVGAIDNVTLTAGSNIRVNSAGSLYVRNGATLNGTVTLDASGINGPAYLYFTGSADQTLGGTGSLKLLSGVNYKPYIYNNNGVTKATFGSGLNIDAASGAYINGWFDNNATFGVSTSGSTLDINGYNTALRFTNYGTLSASNNATLLLSNVTNAGTINVDNATVEFAGTYAGSDLGTINRTGTSNVFLSGTMENTGSTLTLNATTGSYTARSLNIRNGTIATSGGASLNVATNYNAAVTGVTLTAGSEIKVAPGSSLTAFGGMTLNGTVTLDASPNAGTPYLYVGNDETISGTGTIRMLSSASYRPYLYNNTFSAKATLGSGLTVDAADGGYFYGWIDSGASTTVSTNGRTLDISGFDALRRFKNTGAITAGPGTTLLLTNFTNAGTINVNGAAIEFNGSYLTADLGTINRTGTTTVAFNGLLNNTGSTLTLNAATGSYDLRSGTVKNGTIATSGGASLNALSGYYGILDHVTVASGGLVKASGNSGFYVRNGLTLNGTITADASPVTGTPYLYFDGESNQTVSGTGTVNLLGSSGYAVNFNNTVSSSTRLLTLASGITTNVTGPGSVYGFITNNGTINVTAAGSTVTVQGYDVTRKFTNAGTLALNSGTLNLTSFANNGVINVKGGRANFVYNGAAENPVATIKAILTASHATNFSTASIRSTTAVAGSLGLGYRDYGNTVSVLYTYYGDADLDGGVSINDFNTMSNNFGQSAGQIWVNGDFDYDGSVSINDFNLLASNFGKSVPASAADWLPLLTFAAAHNDLVAFEAVTGVPEPTGLVAVGGLAVLVGRRRRVA